MTNASIRPYEDRAYSTYRSAMKAAVRAIARIGMPVGVLAWAGGHAQVITGYVVTGADPKTSSDFTIQWLYLSDPLKSSAIVNRKTSYGAMKDGALKWRFQWYRETDSPYDDPYTSGWIRSSVKPTVGPSEWYHKWVLLLPVRRGLPPPAPAPTPTPTPDAHADTHAGRVGRGADGRQRAGSGHRARGDRRVGRAVAVPIAVASPSAARRRAPSRHRRRRPSPPPRRRRVPAPTRRRRRRPRPPHRRPPTPPPRRAPSRAPPRPAPPDAAAPSTPGSRPVVAD